MYQLLRYLIVGGVNTVLGYIVIFGMMFGFGIGPLLSNVIGYSVCLTFSFVLNKRFTFVSSANYRREVVPFVVVFMVAYALNLVVVFVLVYVLSISSWVSQLIGGVFYVAASFLLNKLYVFKSIK